MSFDGQNSGGAARQSRGSAGAGGAGQGGGRRRLPPALVEVVSTEMIAPRLRSVRVTGSEIGRFAEAAPTAHIKVFLPAPGQDAPTMPTDTPEGRVWPEDQPRPMMRTYTPRSFDPTTNTLEIQFVLHGVGPASEWAERAQVGDKIALGGPGGRFTASLATPKWWIAGDESALPAIGMLLDALPASAAVDVHLEVASPEDEIEFSSNASASVTWHHRANPDRYGDTLVEAACAAQIDTGTQVWVGCEADAVRTIRRHMLSERNHAAELLVTRGYWRVGEADHPDHDHGED